MKKYITGGFQYKIEEVEMIKETEHTLWYISKAGFNYNTRKNSAYTQVHDTFNQAKAFLLKKEIDSKERLSKQLQSCIDRIEEIEKLTN